MNILNTHYRMSNTDIITADDIGKPVDFFMDKMKAYGGTNPQSSSNPSLIILGGSPGVGKSTIIKKLAEKNEFIRGDNYLVISLDNLVENYEPYRQATRDIALRETEVNLTKKNNYNNPDKFNANFQKIRKAIGKLSGAYLKYMNPFIKIRDEIFKEAVKRGYNIVYDTTFKKRDIIEDDILPYLTTSYSAIKVIHLYTLDVKTIKNRLNDRHQKFLKNEDYIRGIHTFLARKFLEENDDGFKRLVEKYGADSRFQFCEFENKGLETPFSCGEYVADKVWVNNVKIVELSVQTEQNRSTTPDQRIRKTEQISPKRGRNGVNTNKKLSEEMKKLSFSKTRKNRLIKKLEESFKNNSKTKANNKIETVEEPVEEPVPEPTRRITRSMIKKTVPK